MKLLEVKFEIKAKLQVAVMILPICGPQQPGALGGGLCCASSVARPGLGFLLWPVTQKYDLSKPPLMTSSPTPLQASAGDRVGGIITSTCSLQLISNFTSRSFILKCLRHFLLEILKKTINA